MADVRALSDAPTEQTSIADTDLFYVASASVPAKVKFEKMRTSLLSGVATIDAINTRLGINEATPLYTLHVGGKIFASEDLYVGEKADTGSSSVSSAEVSRTTTTGVILLQGNDSLVSDSTPVVRYFKGSANTLRIEADGDIRNRDNSYGAISDEKFKENICDASPKSDDLRRIRIRHYNLIGDNKKQIGVIAQELQKVFPGLVAEDEDGNLSVAYSVFTPMLIKAFQEQADHIDALETRIATLEAAGGMK